MSRKRSRSDAVGAAACGAGIVVAISVFRQAWGLPWLAAFGLACVAVLVAGLGVMLSWDAVVARLPRPVPPELAQYVADRQAEGWRKARAHPKDCVVRLPHVHMIRPGGVTVTTVSR